MIINNTSTPGVFLYTPNVEYERGDFVIYEDSIYICTPKGKDTIIISDEEATKSPDLTNFTPYLNKDTATWEDFKEQFINNDVIINDKLVSSSTLSQVIKKLMFGIDTDGIICESIIKNKTGYRVSSNLNRLAKNKPQETGILDYLILENTIPEFNNLSVRISRDEFLHLLPRIDDLSEYSALDKNSVILKQYTYYETINNYSTSSDSKIRVQEVIDHINGVCLYRHARLGSSDSIYSGDEGTVNKISSWKLSCPNMTYLRKVNTLLKFLEDKNNQLNSSQKDSFYFRKLNTVKSEFDLSNKKLTIAVQDSYTQEELKSVTISILTWASDENKKESQSMTVNLSNSYLETTYSFPNGVTIERPKDSRTLILILTLPSTINGCELLDLYVKSN